MSQGVFCEWERKRYPDREFEVRGSAEVHVAAGEPWHTSSGRLVERGSLEYADLEVFDAAQNGDGEQ